jgi:hypothetical protein
MMEKTRMYVFRNLDPEVCNAVISVLIFKEFLSLLSVIYVPITGRGWGWGEGGGAKKSKIIRNIYTPDAIIFIPGANIEFWLHLSIQRPGNKVCFTGRNYEGIV